MKKILAIQFKYFGDAVFLTPALLAIKKKFPNSEIHVLVAQEIAPVFNNLKYIDKIWDEIEYRFGEEIKSVYNFSIDEATRAEKLWEMNEGR